MNNDNNLHNNRPHATRVDVACMAIVLLPDEMRLERIRVCHEIEAFRQKR